MIERDYILRMIQLLTAGLVKIVARRDVKEYDDALIEIDATSEQLIGMKWKTLRSFNDEQLIKLLGFEETLTKMLVAAELLREESGILHETGKTDESVIQGMKAFSLIAELIIAEESFLTVTSVEKFTSLLQRLEEYEFPPALEVKRFRYYEIIGELLRAEEVMKGLIEHDPAMTGEAVLFYNRLKKKSDEELQKGGLLRSTIEETLRRLEPH